MLEKVSSKLESKEMSNESVLNFSSNAMQEKIAPISYSSHIGERILLAARRLKWNPSRAKSVWYQQESTVINGAELKQVERVSGLIYAKEELRQIDQIIADLERLGNTTDQDFYISFASALRSAATAITPEIEG